MEGEKKRGDRETDQNTQLVHEDFQGSRTQLVQRRWYTLMGTLCSKG